ncbi:hypothetical protein WAI453_008322 [Rhynchosporium graminicola]
MNGLPNHKFSIARNREITGFESTLDSVTRRLKFSKGLPKAEEYHRLKFLQEMPHPNSRNEDPSSQFSSGRKKNKNGDNLASPYTASEGTDNIELHHGLGELIRAGDLASQAMASVLELYQRYARDIREAAENRENVARLELLCRTKDGEIEKRKHAFEVMLERNEKDVAEVEHGKESLAEDRKEFEHMKSNFQRSKQSEEMKAKVAEAERSRTYDIKLKKEMAVLDKSFKERKENLEKTTKKREEDDKKTITALETRVTTLSVKLDDCKVQARKQVVDMTVLQQKLQKMEKLRELSDNEVLRVSNELNRVKNEFKLTANTPESYIKGFSEISSMIASISNSYFAHLKVDDLREAQDTILELDPSFGSVPFSDSAESKKLRQVHVQCVITERLNSVIWQPFSSETTLQNPRLSTFLTEIATSLADQEQDKANGVRRARVWSTLTCRGLSLLEVDQKSSQVAKFVQAVLHVFRVLVIPAQRSKLELDLSSLAEAAISLWDEAQQDELDIRICDVLDVTHHDQWRSTTFEPMPIEPPAITDCNTERTIQILFPRIIAKKQVVTAERHLLVPGSFDPMQTTRQVEIIPIHPGIGLGEWSALVKQGKVEAEKIRADKELEQKQLAEFIERSKNEFYARKSVGCSISVPSSPLGNLKPLDTMPRE